MHNMLIAVAFVVFVFFSFVMLICFCLFFKNAQMLCFVVDSSCIKKVIYTVVGYCRRAICRFSYLIKCRITHSEDWVLQWSLQHLDLFCNSDKHASNSPLVNIHQSACMSQKQNISRSFHLSIFFHGLQAAIGVFLKAAFGCFF